MANRFLKGLAVAAGTGLAMGISSGRARSRGVRYRSAPSPDRNSSTDADTHPAAYPDEEEEFLNIEPLLDRLERLEARIEAIERRPAPSHHFEAPYAEGASVQAVPGGEYADLLAELDRRVEENTHELSLLRAHVTQAEARVTESVVSMERTVIETREALPAFVERNVAIRFDELRERFSAEMEDAHERTLASFERAIDDKISSRIGSIEKTLEEQAGSINALRMRATETDHNLQRLVTAIEKLCERTQLVAPEAPRLALQRPALEVLQPFDSQLQEAMRQEAMRREPVVPVLRAEEPVMVPAPAFTGVETAPKKSRFLFRNLMMAGFSLLAARFFR